MKKYLSKIGLAVMAVLGLLGTKAVNAAADADLTAGFASTTAIFTDNKSAIIDWLVGIFLVLIIIALVFGALKWTRRQASGIFGGGRKRR